MSSSIILPPGQMPVAPGANPDMAYFDDLNSEVGDKGFLVTSTEDEAPALDEGLRDGLTDFVAARKAGMTDMWY